MTRNRNIQAIMRNSLLNALRAHEKLAGQDRIRALSVVGRINAVKFEIEAEAARLGYARACQRSMPVCKGACCRRHFPENLSAVDFFIAVSGMSGKASAALIRHMRGDAPPKRQCPLLCEDGCFFSFRDRPLVCTIAYPCFVKHGYWKFLSEKQARVHGCYQELNRMVTAASR